MENYFLEKDVRVLYVTASSFPEDVLAAHQKLHTLIPYLDTRRYFGISNPDKTGTIIYKAAAEEIAAGEAATHNLETLILKMGNYNSIVIRDYQKQIQEIGRAFTLLLSDKNIDPLGHCVEWYLNNNDVRCMVRLTK